MSTSVLSTTPYHTISLKTPVHCRLKKVSTFFLICMPRKKKLDNKRKLSVISIVLWLGHGAGVAAREGREHEHDRKDSRTAANKLTSVVHHCRPVPGTSVVPALAEAGPHSARS